ncbi:hypothetical protein EH233_20830 [Anabaena sp. YBS01]|nr:hypothetical protein EH233_20830 [Anabaena sp. YBS01]QHD83126.1 hypothetical protein GSQ19_05665 [Trichormus variabilis 0441]
MPAFCQRNGAFCWGDYTKSASVNSRKCSDRHVGQFHVELAGQKITQALKYLHEAAFEVEVH